MKNKRRDAEAQRNNLEELKELEGVMPSAGVK